MALSVHSPAAPESLGEHFLGSLTLVMYEGAPPALLGRARLPAPTWLGSCLLIPLGRSPRALDLVLSSCTGTETYILRPQPHPCFFPIHAAQR